MGDDRPIVAKPRLRRGIDAKDRLTVIRNVIEGFELTGLDDVAIGRQRVLLILCGERAFTHLPLLLFEYH